MKSIKTYWPLAIVVILALLRPAKPTPTVSSEVPVAASATEPPAPDQPSDDGPGALTPSEPEAAPELEPPPTVSGLNSYPVQHEAAATPIPVVSQPVRTTYGAYYSCGPNGCSVVYPTYSQPTYQRRGIFRRW